ncbi:bile acid:sodium symporter family protein [Cysteiniphilum halobium]|uniref:bile acid:sodium symporter family protein n=1 Tax=Cysteiniphilum halobium TaxID=2219059 RepID=UPI000E654469|nr:bile acid:sodium symporter family protein [Cysteiniphilum halobium]
MKLNNYAVIKSFSIIVICGALVALCLPDIFTPLKALIPLFLGIIMFLVGINVTLKNMQQIIKIKGRFVVMIVLKSFVIALIAYMIGRILQLDSYALIGLVIVGACPGGTASNVMSLLSKANLALTVSLTLVTTLLAPIVMPSILYLFLHKTVTIPWVGILTTTFMIVVLPILAGILFQRYVALKPHTLNRVSLLAIITIVIVVMIVVALNKEALFHVSLKLCVAVVLLHILASAVGYLLGKLLNLDHQSALALLFEFSILDVGLGIVIAILFFGKLAAIAGTLYAVWQNIAGPILVSLLSGVKQNQMAETVSKFS